MFDHMDEMVNEKLTAENERLQAEVERLRNGQWTDEERKLFLFEATKASYAEGTRAGCEELSIEAAKMSVELEESEVAVERLRDEAKASEELFIETHVRLQNREAEVERLRAHNETLLKMVTRKADEVEKLREALKSIADKSNETSRFVTESLEAGRGFVVKFGLKDVTLIARAVLAEGEDGA